MAGNFEQTLHGLPSSSGVTRFEDHPPAPGATGPTCRGRPPHHTGAPRHTAEEIREGQNCRRRWPAAQAHPGILPVGMKRTAGNLRCNEKPVISRVFLIREAVGAQLYHSY